MRSVSFSPDGSRIVSGGSDGTVRQWDAESGVEIGAPLEGHEGWVRSVSYSPDGSRIVSGDSDGTVRQWDAESGAEIGAPLEGHGGPVGSVSYSPDGSRIVSGDSDGMVREWDAESSAEIGAPLGLHEGQVLSVSFDPDGIRLVTGGNGTSVRLWDVRILTPPLLIWVLLLAVVIDLFFFVQALLMAWRDADAPRQVVPALVSDAPISDPTQATGALRKVVTRISHFVSNPNASAPLIFAVIGQWGSGKSSLMKLIERELRNDHFPCVWFNAWHHQNETHLFAALMESIRLNAVVPRSLRTIGNSLEFRARLIWQRCRNAPLAVFALLILLAVDVCLFVVLGQGIDFAGIFASIWDDTDPPTNQPSIWRLSVPSILLIGIVKSRWNPLKTFGVTPASLIRASVAWIQFPHFRDRLSFRDQFGRAFGEVCQAFGSRRLVIVIDDLDRCRPEQVVEILEAVNFLTSNGDCFVLLGIDESQVEHAVGLHYRDIAEEMTRGGPNITGGLSESDKYQARRSYARHYLKKLINLRVTVPVVDDRDLLQIRKAGQS